MPKCVIENCNNEGNVKGTARGLCRSHYKRYIRYGDATVELRKEHSWKDVHCTECTHPIYANGLCVNHYAVIRRRVDKEGNKRRSAAFKARREERLVSLAGRPRATLCDICSEECKTVWDHGHTSELFRGWLCDRCNRVLGSVKDNRELLDKMSKYLEETKYAKLSNNGREE